MKEGGKRKNNEKAGRKKERVNNEAIDVEYPKDHPERM
jgi:hypothetical protein